MTKERGSGKSGAPALEASAEYVDQLHAAWSEDPSSVPESWRHFFAGFELGATRRAAPAPRGAASKDEARDQSNVASLIYAYRSLGHRIAAIDPLGHSVREIPELELDRFGLSPTDDDRVFDTGHLFGLEQRATLRGILDHLSETYCRAVGVEYLHLQDVRCRRWLQAEMEPSRNRPAFDRRRRLDILRLLVDAELFETFIGTRYPGQKRFSIEGAECVIPALHAIVELAPDLGLSEIVFGMSHRGRLNVLANILDKTYETIFSEFEENIIPSMYGGNGDVKYHKGFSSDHTSHSGQSVHLSLTANPSHLEAVDPVVEGRVRAKQRRHLDTELRRNVLPLLIHGDAAFAGQGLVTETLNLSQLKGYRTGGTVHVIINNQIGFTTLPEEARSTPYCTDVAKIVEAPIFHVNGDDPEAVVHVAELALRFRQEFGRDVVVDMLCYRRHGHQEGDEPAFTQPLLYREIEEHPPVRKIYTKWLLESGDLAAEEADRIAWAIGDQLQRSFDAIHPAGTPGAAVAVPAPAPPPARLVVNLPYQAGWEGLVPAFSFEPVETAVSREALLEVARAISTVPPGFTLHKKVARMLPAKLEAVLEGGVERRVDWALAEALAFGTLLAEGIPVRLSGQDSARGTFSHRHALWLDARTGAARIPLNSIREGQARFCLYNSMLSEAAVLGFEYGYSLEEPRMLILWEAQFGDFANGAQVIIDQFIVASQAKWQRSSGLVMLLPHGYEGQGPEHSNAYLERYLAACAEENLLVVNLTTPAQYFHALRRQVKTRFRRPLVVMSPKSLLRSPRCTSSVTELEEGRFEEILDDPAPPEGTPRKLLFVSGKIFYDLLEAREREGVRDVAMVRIEQLYPLAVEKLAKVVKRYRGAGQVFWVQEEPANRGAWTYTRPRLEEALGGRALGVISRPASASPATGSLRMHTEEQRAIVRSTLLDQGA